MTWDRLSMRTIREVLRLKHKVGLSNRASAWAIGFSIVACASVENELNRLVCRVNRRSAVRQRTVPKLFREREEKKIADRL